jgi:hypothetical protein
MKQRALVFAALVVLMLGIGVHTLMRNLTLGVFREEAPAGQQETTRAPEPTQAPLVMPMAVPSPRALVEDDVTAALKAENEQLKARVQQLEAVRPTTRGELAVVLGIKETDLTYLLNRSELLPDAAALADAVKHAGAKATYDALRAEAALYRSMADFKAKNPCEPANRVSWHSTTWVPFYSKAINDVCLRLYQLNLPSQLVEPFRNRLSEGI